MSYLLKTKINLGIITLGLLWLGLGNAGVFAQGFKHLNYDWDKETTVSEIPDSLKEESAVYLKYHLYQQFNPETSSDKTLHFLSHTRILVNDDKAIEKNNRIYISQRDGAIVNEIKARVIQPDGKVVVLDKSNIKKGIDEESEVEYSYYALDGLQIGSEVESIINIQYDPSFYGNVIYFQKSDPILDFHFEYTHPEFLEFAFKTYNTPMKGTVETENEQSTYTYKSSFIPKSKSEPMSHSKVNGQYVILKLDKNHSKNLLDINGYGYYSQIIGERGISVKVSKSAAKKLKKLYQNLDLPEKGKKEKKALAIEHYVKTNFTFVDNNSAAELENLERIFQNKAFNSFGALQLYKNLFDKAGLECEAIFTCDKSRLEFDEDYETYLFLGKMLLGVKGTDYIFDPSDNLGRGLFFDPMYQGHKGLFIRERTIGDITTAIGKVKTIPETSADDNLSDAIINVDIKDKFADVKIDIEQSVNGQVAKNFQPIFPFVEEKELDNFYSYIMYSYSSQYIASTLEFKNTAEGDFPSKPLTYNFEVNSEDYLEKGGNTYILKLGALIGPQTQMYNEDNEDREYDIRSAFARRYTYEITFNIPTGYEAVNIEDIKMDIKDEATADNFHFISSYTQEGDKVTIIIDELYDKSGYPAELFMNYQKVINAAADFNKLNILFKPI